MTGNVFCPTEFRSIEQVDFPDGRKLAYLTFLNESEETIHGLTGCFTMLDENRRPIGRRQVSFNNLNVKPRAVYALNFQLDDCPAFSDAYMFVQSVSFLAPDSWRADQSQYVPKKQPNVVSEFEKAALLYNAHDAVCFPEQFDTYWLCVCGRHNQNGWNMCSECRRIKYKVFREFHKETVIAAYRQMLHQKDASDAQRRMTRQRRDSIRAKEQKIKKIERILLFATLFVMIGALLILGFLQSIKNPNRLNDSQTIMTYNQSPRSTPTIDYLEPV